MNTFQVVRSEWRFIPITLLLAIVLVLLMQLNLDVWIKISASNSTTLPLMQESKTPRIVLWTKFYDHFDYSGTGVDEQLWEQCPPTTRCELVYINRTEELREADGIVFHVRNLEWNELPTLRHSDQVWVFFALESPEHSGMPGNHLERYNHIFNWTMTYRHDSDVFYPYGVITRLQQPNTPHRLPPAQNGVGEEAQARLRVLIANKTELAATTVTHCNTPSRRESLVRTLQHYAQVDVFGRCSINATCGLQDEINKCQSMACKFTQFKTCYSTLAQSHKFYLSFENSLCVDYVTEKFFMALQHDIVPVVYGGANYTALAPQISYIDARSFKSPLQLAKYLKWLDVNPDEYLKYFQWKRNYNVSVSQAVGWCNLCARLRNRRQVKRKSYEDIRGWWISNPTTTTAATHKSGANVQQPACEKREPKYEFEGWEVKKFNRQYR